jgi:hypothetical protein
MLVLILDRTAAIERIVALATEPRVPEQFMLGMPADPWRMLDLVMPALVSHPDVARQREPVLAGARHVGPAW